MSDFELIKEWPLINSWPPLVQFRDPLSGIQHYHFESPETQKTLVIAVPIQLENDKGIAHVLEHWLLAGSDSYPVDGLFFQLPARSLKLDANAFTYSDITGFHATTRLQTDFENLLEVYADAVFRPLLKDKDFAREAVAVDTDGLIKGGVVYNEMRGIISSGVNDIVMAVQSAMWSSGTHKFNAGGYPQDIARLSASETRSFWRRYYRPDNALLITYGDMDVSRVQDVMAKAFAKMDLSFRVDLPAIKRSTLNTKHLLEIATSKSELEGAKVFAWNLSEPPAGEAFTTVTGLQNTLLAQLLLKSLTSSEENIDNCQFIQPLCRLEQEIGCNTLILTVKPGAKDFDTFGMEQCLLTRIVGALTPSIIQQTQQAFVKSQTVFGGERLPPGVDLSKRLLGLLLHKESLADEPGAPAVEEVVKNCSQPEAVTQFVKSLFDEARPHVEATLVLTESVVPNADNTASVLASSTFSESKYKPATSTSREIIPALAIEEIPRKPWIPEYSVASLKDSVTVAYKTGCLGEQARVFGASSREAGYAKLLQNISNSDPDGRIDLEFRACPKNPDMVLAGVFTGRQEDTGARLRDKVEELTNDDVQKTLEQVKATTDLLRKNQPHEFAMQVASRRVFNVVAPDSHEVADVSLAKMKSQLHRVVNLESAAKVFERQDASYSEKQKVSNDDTERKNVSAVENSKLSNIKTNNKTAFSIEGELNYCVRSLPLPAFNDTDSMAAAYILAARLELEFLQPLVRSQGSAYGTAARVRHDLGTLCLFSFRDPHFEQTFEIFDCVLKQCLSESWEPASWPDYQRAALGAMQRFGNPETLNTKHFRDLVFGYEPCARAAVWRAVLDMDIASFKTRINRICAAGCEEDVVVGCIRESRARDFGFSVHGQQF